MHEQPTAPSPTPVADNYEAFPPGMQRLAAASGILFVILLIISIVVSGESFPDGDAAPAEYLQWATDEKDGIELGALFTGLAAIEWLWFVGVVTSALSRAEAGVRGFARVSWVVPAGGVVAVALILAGTALLAGAATAPEDTEASVVRALVHANIACFALASAGFAAMFVAAGIVILRAGGFPRWLGFLGLAVGTFYTLTLFTLLMPEDDGGAFEVAWPLSLLTLVIWVVAASVHLLREVGRNSALYSRNPE
jgi:hypothetical protein